LPAGHDAPWLWVVLQLTPQLPQFWTVSVDPQLPPEFDPLLPLLPLLDPLPPPLELPLLDPLLLPLELPLLDPLLLPLELPLLEPLLLPELLPLLDPLLLPELLLADPLLLPLELVLPLELLELPELLLDVVGPPELLPPLDALLPGAPSSPPLPGAHAWMAVVAPGSTMDAQLWPDGQPCFESQRLTHVPVCGRHISLSPHSEAPCVSVHDSPAEAVPLDRHAKSSGASSAHVCPPGHENGSSLHFDAPDSEQAMSASAPTTAAEAKTETVFGLNPMAARRYHRAGCEQRALVLHQRIFSTSVIVRDEGVARATRRRRMPLPAAAAATAAATATAAQKRTVVIFLFS
jgi:hypothetical protein